MKLLGFALTVLLMISLPTNAQTMPPQNAQGQTSSVQTTTVSSSTTTVETDDALKHKIKAWKLTLSQMAKQENTCIFFDVAPDDVPPNTSYDHPVGVPAMRALATSTRRTWKQVDGVQTFSRAQDPANPVGGSADVNQVVSWIATLSPAQRKSLIQGGLSFDQIDTQSRTLLSRVAGWWPDMTFVLIEKGDQVGVGLELRTRIAYTNPKTGQRVEREIPGRASHVKVPTTSKPVPYEPLATAAFGPLDFGKGTLLTLADIVDKAQVAFRTRYTAVDGRVASNWYFVSGTLTQTAFEDVLAQATAISPLRRKAVPPVDRTAARDLLDDPEFLEQEIDVSELRDELPTTGSRDTDALTERFGAKETLSAQDFLSCKTETVAELSNGKPGLTAWLDRLGLTPDTPLVLSAMPALVIETDGDHLASGSYGTMNGQPVPVTMPNESVIGLW